MSCLNPRSTAHPFGILLILILFAANVSGQSAAEDSMVRLSAFRNSAAVYLEQEGDQSVLNNGSLYLRYPKTFRQGTAYYPADEFSPGTLVYDGVRFDSLFLLFDALQQVLVYKKNSFPLQLVNEKISSFTISGHRFLHLISDKNNSGLPYTGFYEVLYDDPSQGLKYIDKSIQEESFATDGIPRFMISKERYFVKSGGVYKEVRSIERTGSTNQPMK